MSKKKLLLKNGVIFDPQGVWQEESDILIEDTIISFVGPNVHAQDAETVDLKKAMLTPGLIDMHVHLREPGREDKETILTGSRAAVAGGFTTIACMPNTNPVNDNQAVTDFILSQAKRAGLATVLPVGSISRGLEGKELSEIGEMVQSGIVAVSDDGKPVMNAELMRRTLEYCKLFSIPVIEHAEEKNLAAKGVMHEGYYSTLLGFPAQPDVAESIMVQRDIQLADYTGGHIHIAHVSTARSVEIIRQAKEQGINVTCEVTPHHLVLTDENLQTFNTNYKMSPPLRSRQDVVALQQALEEGIIDAIASDHAPHTVQEKELEFNDAPNGIIGLETTLPVLFTKLVEPGIISLRTMITALTSGPARVLGLGKRRIEAGCSADITVIEPDFEYSITPESFYSKSRNTPFAGWKVRGRAKMTIVQGKICYSADQGGAAN